MKAVRRAATALLACALALWMAVGAAAITVVAPSKSFYVSDYANVLSEETEQAIVRGGDALAAATGAEFVVVTVDFLNGSDINDYAYTLFNNWKLGDPEKNNGLLLLLSIGDDDYYAMQGQGLEKTLSSGRIGELLDTYLEPDFAAGRYDEGVKRTYDALLKEFERIYKVDLSGESPEDVMAKRITRLLLLGLKIYLILVALLIVIGLIAYLVSERKKPKTGATTYRRQWKGYGPPPPSGWTWGGYVRSNPSRPGRPYNPSAYGGFGASSSRPSNHSSSSSRRNSSGSSHRTSHSSGVSRRSGGGSSRGGGVGRRR